MLDVDAYSSFGSTRVYRISLQNINNSDMNKSTKSSKQSNFTLTDIESLDTEITQIMNVEVFLVT